MTSQPSATQTPEIQVADRTCGPTQDPGLGHTDCRRFSECFGGGECFGGACTFGDGGATSSSKPWNAEGGRLVETRRLGPAKSPEGAEVGLDFSVSVLCLMSLIL
uniref:Uncharacterized protein n=1 Tax=Eutreptiella gymnastica TaxID=73025 RepID=A0A7S4FSB9_9EUGL